MIDKEAFLLAKNRAMSDISEDGGIGTLGEKLVHKTLKHYFEPRTEYHEVSFLDSVADIKNGGGIIEIQTRAFERLLPKLRRFLSEQPVNLVYPIVRKRRIFRLDKTSGEISAPRKSPREGKASDALFELSKIREYLSNPRLTVTLFFLDADEYRAKGEKRRGKSLKIDCIPTEPIDILTIRGVGALSALIPDTLGMEFTSAQFSRSARLKGRRASYSLSLLYKLGLLSRRREGRSYLYMREAGYKINP